MSEIGELLIGTGFVLLVLGIITFDPPSGYNMGTGDSYMFKTGIPILIIILGAIFRIV